METKSFTKSSLSEFIHSPAFDSLENHPISRHRAISQIQNPRADSDDVLLVAVFEGTKTVGYLGVLPDFILQNGIREKVGWLTCFWVDEAYKSKNIAANLFLRVIKAWKKKILITNIVPFLEPVYQKTKLFYPTQYKVGIRCFRRFNFAEILPPKNAVFVKFKPLLSLADGLLNGVLRWSIPRFSEKNGGFTFNEIGQVDTERDGFMAIDSGLTARGSVEFNWILNFPWVLQMPENEESKKYFFTSVSPRFYQKVFKVTNKNGVISGFFMLKIRESQLTIPYFFIDSSAELSVLNFISNFMEENDLSMVTVFHTELVKLFKKQGFPFFYKRPISKPYFIAKELEPIVDLQFQDGDGDCAFY